MAAARGRSSSLQEDSRQVQPPLTPRLRPSDPHDHPLFEGSRHRTNSVPRNFRRQRSLARRESGDPKNELLPATTYNPREALNSDTDISQKVRQFVDNKDLKGLQSYRKSLERSGAIPASPITEDTSTVLLPARTYNPQESRNSVAHSDNKFRQQVQQFVDNKDLEGLQAFRETLACSRSRSRTVFRVTEDTSRVSTPIMASSNAFPALDTSLPATGNRSAGVSPTGPSSMNGSNGINGPSAGAAAAYMSPLPVGHQQDLNHLFNQIQELGTLLRSNRDKVNSITKDAEEVAKRANGALSNGDDAGTAENDKARIRELELELSKQKHLVELYKHEQKENTSLIAMYEEAMGTAVEQIRNYCGDIEGRFLRQRRHYNDLLQAEKDEHLASRLDRDHWHAQTVKVCEMIRTAHRLRSEEWHEEYAIIAALQGEVRILRRVFDMEPQAPEEETGWPYLKDLPLPE